MIYPIKSPRKLIEVALPLDAINAAASREKSIRHGHPSTLHLWWARRPLAAARAVIFAQLVNDPGYQQGGGFKYGRNKKEAAIERKRLFKIIEDLVLWENTTNDEVLERARSEIRRSWREVCELNRDHPQAAELFDPDKIPALHDPFAGGGAIPLEAQRLGLEAWASDLNPVAVLINKAMIEIPPKFAGRSPIGPMQSDDRQVNFQTQWAGASGLAEDVRRYGAWMREEATKRIGHLYPPTHITAEMAQERPDLKHLVGQNLTVIAWLWARTVKSPNPAFSHLEVPLLTSFELCSKPGAEAWLDPVLGENGFSFRVRRGAPPADASAGTKAAGRGADFRCIFSNAPISAEYIRSEAKRGRLGSRMVGIVAEGPTGRVYLPVRESDAVSQPPTESWCPDTEFFKEALGFRVGNYGMSKWSDLFSPRQRLALNTLYALAAEAGKMAQRAWSEATKSASGSVAEPERSHEDELTYGQAVELYLSLATSRVSDKSSMLAWWMGGAEKMAPTFSRPTLSMVWDWAEMNPFCSVTSNFQASYGWVAESVEFLPASLPGHVLQQDAQSQQISIGKVVCTDPPYYDNIGYADLSDFFYVWLRKYLQHSFPTLLSTVSVPKLEELVATPARHGGTQLAQAFFLKGMTRCFKGLAQSAHVAFPVAIFYAFKQAETTNVSGTSSSGWETFLEAVLRAGFVVSGTWPVRTERSGGLRERDRNSLASSIVLACRKRPADAATISRREFLRELNGVLPEALDEMTRGSGDDRSPVAPVDLSQAIIGPGMAVFSKYAAVLEADGSPMSVRTALQLINRFLAEDDFDADTQFCLHWFEQHGWTEGAFGDADTLSRGKGTSVDGMRDAGVLQSGSGKVRLLRWSEYPFDWDPRADKRTPVWEALHQLIRALRQGGDSASGALLAALGGKAEAARQLAYRLYTLCERLGQAEDARAYNELITSWTGIESASTSTPKPTTQHLPGFEE